jgi:hypothetical protein
MFKMTLQEEVQKFETNTLSFLDHTIETLSEIDSNVLKSVSISYEEIEKKRNEVFLYFQTGMSEIALRLFINKTWMIWNQIQCKNNDKFFTSLELLFPEKSISSSIKFLMGYNSEEKAYISEEDQEFFWVYLQAMIHNSMKYLNMIQDRSFMPSNFNFESEKKKWKFA